MVLQASGEITLGDIQYEFNTSEQPPYEFSDWYYPNSDPFIGGIPSSGALQFTDFYGASKKTGLITVERDVDMDSDIRYGYGTNETNFIDPESQTTNNSSPYGSITRNPFNALQIQGIEVHEIDNANDKILTVTMKFATSSTTEPTSWTTLQLKRSGVTYSIDRTSRTSFSHVLGSHVPDTVYKWSFFNNSGQATLVNNIHTMFKAAYDAGSPNNKIAVKVT